MPVLETCIFVIYISTPTPPTAVKAARQTAPWVLPCSPYPPADYTACNPIDWSYKPADQFHERLSQDSAIQDQKAIAI